MVSIIVTAFSNNVSFFPFLNILLGPIKSSHHLLHGVSSYNLAGNLQYFLLAVLCADGCHNFWTPSVRIL